MWIRWRIADRPRTDLRFTLLAGSLIALVKVLLTVHVMTRYGWDRDELYFIEAARHPALGYVDFPPVTSWIGWLVLHTAGPSLFWLRMTGQVAGGIAVVLVALIARDLGGGRGAQSAAAGAWALTPFALGAGSIFHPTQFDAVVWVALSWIVLRVLEGGGMRWWVALGAGAGVGLETKYTVAVFLAALACAVALSPRRRLLWSRGMVAATAIAVVLVVPNLVWQAGHDWASVRFYPSQQAKTAADTSRPAYVAEGMAFLGGTAVLAAAGLVSLWRRRELRPLAVAPAAVVILYFLERGRAYYPVPGLALPVAAGSIAAASWLSSRSARRIAAAAAVVVFHVVVLVVALPLVVPVLSTSAMVHRGIWDTSFYGDELGWQELTADVQHVWRQVPANDRASTVVLAGNYGEAGALVHYGHGLPPVVSGHLSWQYWAPPHLTQRWAITVGYDRTWAATICESWRAVTRVTNRWHVANEEQGRWVGWCHLRAPLGRLWQSRIARFTL
jgi:4-amino-4-deoxy-L-arabinose transferase-like glycosyltransferase